MPSIQTGEVACAWNAGEVVLIAEFLFRPIRDAVVVGVGAAETLKGDRVEAQFAIGADVVIFNAQGISADTEPRGQLFDGGILAKQATQGLAGEEGTVQMQRERQVFHSAHRAALGTAGDADFVNAFLAGRDGERIVGPAAAFIRECRTIRPDLPGHAGPGEGG